MANEKSDEEILAAARSVIERTIGARSKSISLLLIPSVNRKDAYLIEAKKGKLSISGSSVTAITYAFRTYLQKACHSMVTWNGKHLNLPQTWPDYAEEKITSPYQYRYFLNVVTFGYTTPYWNWKRWEQELDWMALHGVNMPLATVASEAIAARVWKKLGLSDAQIAEFFTGPAHLPWHRMGNLNKWDGPIPLSWHLDQLQLQHRILKRMHELGMHPIAPAFAGFVPEGFQNLHPDVEVKRLTWGGFPQEYNAFVLAPNTKYFEQIGKLFIQEWEAEFGKNEFYLSDSFNEMDVPVPKNDTAAKYKLLADYGASIYKSIAAGNPDAVWVTQGWTFGYQHKFWDTETLKAMLKNVPDDKMIIVDLANEFPKYVWHIEQTWKTQQGYHDKKWIYSYVPNFGGKTTYTGDLSLYASGSAEALKSPYAKTLIGFGSAPEGIENNEVIYELLADLGWTNNSIDLDQWLAAYSSARYGAYPQSLKESWNLLRSSVYGSFSSYPRFTWQTVLPDQKRKTALNTSPAFLQAVKTFLQSADQLKSSQLYRADAIELAALYLSIKADDHYKLALRADTLQQREQRDDELAKAVNLLTVVDRLLQSHPTDRLEPWVEAARAHGTNVKQKDYYESNAKRLITTWGAAQSDYAARMWSGLIKDYYIPRMKLQLSDKRNALREWEERWIKTPWRNTTKAYADPLRVAIEMVNQN
ncbi:alpha-N-acetylglucosaminidase [Flavisolibacter ginsenosidimutans]|uniref:Alpha-N-acetylglucosaminidase n=2 Tax=Flavisolibacter ginsenosidimutans TaxID=661481 RepID=A0A5B8UPD7_9BACT|nr:alpha-N-acetylglucosaminidase [Flavisolibacter ginsenosidimutans]